MYKEKLFRLTLSGMLVVITVVLTRFLSIVIPLFGINGIRIDLGFAAIIFAGIALGPLYGAAVGVLADLIGAFAFPLGPYFPGFTFTNFFVGLLPGLLVILYKRGTSKPLPAWLFLFASALSILSASFMNTLWINMLYSKAILALLPPRLIAAGIMIPIITGIVYLLYQSYGILRRRKW